MSESDLIAQAEALFDKYDVNKDNVIDPAELKVLLTDVFKEIGRPAPTEQDVEKVLTESDDNGDREIQRDEFIKIFKLVLQMKSGN